MRARDRILGAVSWWIGLVGLVAGLMRLDPPMHPAARRHCLLGFAGNVLFLALRWWVSAVFSRGDAAALLLGAIACAWLLIVLANTASAAMGRDVFFLDVFRASESSG
jgi:hypothetical protein